MTVTKLLTRLSAAVAVPCLAAALAACAPPAAEPRSPGINLDTAKQSTRSQQEELLVAVPPAAVSTTKQTETSRALFEYETGGYYWPGTMNVVLSAEPTARACWSRSRPTGPRRAAGPSGSRRASTATRNW